jgi:hydrogenase-4 component E
MSYFTSQFLFFLETVLFLSVIFMHLAKKNFAVIFLYALQSFIVTFILFSSSLKEDSLLLMAVATATFFVKVVIAPYFFFGLMKKHRLQFSVSTYLNGPMTLIVLTLLTAFSYSHFFRPLTILSPYDGNALLLAVGMILISLFLIVNRKGVLSQMVGILSLENAIVSFAYITGLEASAGAQVGILFDILVWIVIATGFASMIYRHFGSLDSSAMQHLKEE